MNVLPLVIAILMALAALTYARLDSFLNSSQLRTEYRRAILAMEGRILSEAAETRYDATVVSRKAEAEEDSEDPKARPEKESALHATLYIGGLFTKGEDGRVGDPVAYGWLRNLIVLLYSNQPFYRSVQDVYSDPAEAVLDALIGKVLSMDKRPKQKAALANIELDDDSLHELMYKMMKGSTTVLSIPREAGDYPSLLRFVDLAGEGRPLSVYLAPEALLMAVFSDGDNVAQIVATRKELYRQLVNRSGLTNALATEQFRGRFDSMSPPEAGKRLDFRVTHSKPK